MEDYHEVVQIFHGPEAANSHNVERICFEEYMTFQKVIHPCFKDVGYLSLFGEFFKCYVCTKHYNNETSKDAHDNFCKQSWVYRESLRRIKVALVCRGVPEDFCEYIVCDYLNPEPFSPPPWAALKSNATTPMDESDSTFDPKDEEAKDNDVEDDDRKPAAKKRKNNKRKSNLDSSNVIKKRSK